MRGRGQRPAIGLSLGERAGLAWCTALGRVGGTAATSLAKITHKKPMLSLANAFTAEELASVAYFHAEGVLIDALCTEQ